MTYYTLDSHGEETKTTGSDEKTENSVNETVLGSPVVVKVEPN